MDMELFDVFLNNVVKMLKEMIDENTRTEGHFFSESNEILSKGICSITNFEGKVNGRIMLDIEQSVVLKIVKSLTGRRYETAKEMYVLSTMAELNYSIAEYAIGKLNDKYNFRLKTAPPTVLAAKEALICLDKIPSCSVICKTIFGAIKVNVAFSGEE